MKKVFLFLVLAFIVELIFMGMASQYISGWWIFWWLIMATIVGITIIRKNVAYIIPAAQGGRTSAKHDPATALINILCGMLLVFPGLLGDALALVFLLPPVQLLLKQQATLLLGKYQQNMMESMFKQMGGSGGIGMGGFGGAGQSGDQTDFMAELRKRMEEMQRAAEHANHGEDRQDSRSHSGRKAGEVIDIVAQPVKKSEKKAITQKDAANDQS